MSKNNCFCFTSCVFHTVLSASWMAAVGEVGVALVVEAADDPGEDEEGEDCMEKAESGRATSAAIVEERSLPADRKR
jgi:hypothetical protein